MKDAADLSDAKRPYRQTARAAAAEANAARILAAFRERLSRLWFDEIRLEDVAADAGVTVQTVIRRFSGKEGLLDATVDAMAHEIRQSRTTPPGDMSRAVRAVVEDYETTGDLVLRILAQEGRHPALHRIAEIGRGEHRNWLAQVFAPSLERLPQAEAQTRLDALVVATDVYIWKLVRRDMHRSTGALEQMMRAMIQAALCPASDPSPNPDLPR